MPSAGADWLVDGAASWSWHQIRVIISLVKGEQRTITTRALLGEELEQKINDLIFKYFFREKEREKSQNTQ